MRWRILALAPFLLLPHGPAPAGEIIRVLKDPNTVYEEIGRRDLSGGIVEITTRRTGSQGTTYARREISCRDWTFRYTGNAPTPEELAGIYVNSPFVPLEHGSVSGYIALYVCRTTSQSGASTTTDR